MPKKFYQRCYGNYNGWKELNVSDDYPIAFLKELHERQIQHSSIPLNYMDEFGNILCLREVVAIQEYLYVLNTKYNVLTGNAFSKGRDSNYSQAFVFHMNDVIKDPNLFLGISEQHFPIDFQYSEDAMNKTKTIPTSLTYDMHFNIQEALEIAGLSEEHYRLLIKFIVAEKMLKKARKPIFIQYDGTKKQMKALMYCIFYGLPYFIRRNISMSSCKVDDNSFTDIIFSIQASQYPHYFIPETGKHTCEERLIRTITRSKFIDVLCTKEVPLHEFNEYYSDLEQLIKKLNGEKCSNRELLIILKLIFWMSNDQNLNALSSDELNNRIVDLLEVHNYGNAILDQYLNKMLKVIVEREELLLPHSEERLNECLANTHNQSLKDTALQYQINQLHKLSLEKAIHQLDVLPLETFKLYIDVLNKDEKGNALILSYYEFYLKEKVNDFNDVEMFINIVKFLNVKDTLLQLAKIKCTDIMKDVLYDDLEAHMDEYTNIMLTICDEIELDTYVEEIKQYYWTHFSLDLFNYRKVNEYSIMNTNHTQAKIVNLTYALINKYYELDSCDDYTRCFIKVIHKYELELDKTQLQKVVTLLNREIDANEKYDSAHLSTWLEILCDCGGDTARKIIYSIYQVLQEDDFKDHIKQLKKMKQHYAYDDNQIIMRVNELVYEYYCEIDSEERIVPLDNWLYIAKPKYTNAFEILNNLSPWFMQQEDSYVIETSDCLQGMNDEYRIDAQEYEKSKSKYSKTIKKYRELITKQQKEKKKQDSEAQDEKKEKSSLGRFFSRFKK